MYLISFLKNTELEKKRRKKWVLTRFLQNTWTGGKYRGRASRNVPTPEGCKQRAILIEVRADCRSQSGNRKLTGGTNVSVREGHSRSFRALFGTRPVPPKWRALLGQGSQRARPASLIERHACFGLSIEKSMRFPLPNLFCRCLAFTRMGDGEDEGSRPFTARSFSTLGFHAAF